MNKNDNIKMYGTSWCSDCHRAKSVFENFKVTYTYIDFDKNPEGKEFVTQYNSGTRIVPTIVFPDNSILFEPKNQDLIAMHTVLIII